MKHFMIKYQFTNGTTEEWHREIGRFIAAIDSDPELKGQDHLSLHEEPRRWPLFPSRQRHDEAAQKTLQQRDFFKAYTEMTRKVAAGGEVTVTPIELIGATA